LDDEVRAHDQVKDHKSDGKRIVQCDVDSEETEELDENGGDESEVLGVHCFPRSADLETRYLRSNYKLYLPGTSWNLKVPDDPEAEVNVAHVADAMPP